MPVDGEKLRTRALLVGLTCVLYAVLLQHLTRLGLPWVVGAPLLAVVPLGVWRARREETGGSETSPLPDVSARRAALFLAAIVAVALALRLIGLASRATWEDEMWTLRNVMGGDLGTVLRIAADDYWPPLHYVVLNLWARVTDTSMLSMRVPSVLFAVATVAVLPAVGRTVLGSRRLGLVAALMLAGMTAHVLYAQEARTYAMLVFFAVLSAHWFYRSFWEGRVSPAFLLATTALTYSHSFSTWYFLTFQWAYAVLAVVLWKRRDLLKAAITSQALVGVLFLPVAGLFLQSRLSRSIEVPFSWGTGLQSISLLSVLEQFQSLSVRSWVGAALQAVLFASALVLLLRRAGPRSADPAPAREADPLPGAPGGLRPGLLFLLCWALVPVATSLVGTLVTPMETFGPTRYHLAVLPGMCLLAAAGLAGLRSRTGWAVAVASIVLVAAWELPRFYRTYAHARYDLAADYLRGERTDAEPILAGNAFRAFAYYWRGEHPRIGSAEWDAFVGRFERMTDRYTDAIPRLAATYALERLPPEITFVRYTVPPGVENPHDLAQRTWRPFLVELGEAGTLSGPFWVVIGTSESKMMDEVRALGYRCEDGGDFPGVLVRRCRP